MRACRKRSAAGAASPAAGAGGAPVNEMQSRMASTCASARAGGSARVRKAAASVGGRRYGSRSFAVLSLKRRYAVENRSSNTPAQQGLLQVPAFLIHFPVDFGAQF